MAIAKDSAEFKKLLAEKGIEYPRIGSGQNKMPPGNLTADNGDDRYEDTHDEDDDDDHGMDDASLISMAKKRWEEASSIEAMNRTAGVDDLKFLNGQQWSEADASARAADGRPCITENRLPTFANQITNEQRQNRPSIDISPMGDKASQKDSKMLRGMIRAIERDSSADVAYDTGFQSAVHNGWGYWRIMTEYESVDSFNKVIVIRPIFNPMNVYLDPARTPFMLDAQWGFISEMIPLEEFKREYPNASHTGWAETGTGDNDRNWFNNKEVRVAEHYYFEHVERRLVMLDTGHQGWYDELSDSVRDNIKAGAIDIQAERIVQVPKLKWCKMTSIEVLERRDCDGMYVPIIECDGTLLNIDGKVTKKGIVRDAKSPQMMSNYYSTLEAENVALQPKAPWIMEEGQIEGHEAKWNQANKKSYAYLLYKNTNVNGQPAPPPQRQAFQGPPAAILAAKQGTTEALKAVTGIRFDATMSERMQDESGRAIRELNNNANLGAYHYIDNFGRALKNTGIVLCDMIPYVYDTKRIVSILDEGGNEDRVMISPDMKMPHAEVRGATPDNPDGKVKMFNPKIGRYQVTVTIGPSYATKRIEAAESQMDFMKTVPNAAPLIMDLVAKNSDWDGAEEIANRLAKAVPANMMTPDREDMSPQVQAILESQQQQLQQAQQQIQQMSEELLNRDKDRQVMMAQIDSTFKAKQDKTESDHNMKLLQINKDFEGLVLTLAQKMEDTAAKREATFHGTIGRNLAELSKAVAALQPITVPTLPAGNAGSNPPLE